MGENIRFIAKYRPSTLEGFVGNSKVKETVKEAMNSGGIPQKVLIEGISGCGKTTMAQIIASLQGGSIEKISMFDVMTKEDISSLVGDMLSTKDKKVFILDDCFAIRVHVGTLLLEALDELPENVTVICTICDFEYNYITDALRDSCQLKLNVSNPDVHDLSGVLKDICTKEGIGYDVKGLDTICDRSSFIVKGAIDLLQHIASKRGTVFSSDVSLEVSNG